MEQRVLDALFDRNERPRDSCLVVNEAGLELARPGPETLEAIERVLRVVVAPQAAERDRVAAAFTGLPYVLGATLLISRRAGLDSAPFPLAMPAAIQEETVHALSAFFRWSADGTNFGLSPGRRLGLLPRALAESADVGLRDAARAERHRIEGRDANAFLD